MNDVPRELSWVEARFNCSIEQMFRELFDGVSRDVEVFNLVRQTVPDVAFWIEEAASGKAFTVRQGQAIRPTVEFSLNANEITIRDEVTSQVFSVTHTFSDEGRCKLRIAGEELEQWQVRKRVLEGLLFVPMSSR